MPVGHFLLESTDASLRTLSLVCLYTAIYLQGDLFDTGRSATTGDQAALKQQQTLIRQWFERPLLRRIDQLDGVIYVSAIGLPWAAKLNLDPLILVRQIAEALIREQSGWSGSCLPEFEAGLDKSGEQTGDIAPTSQFRRIRSDISITDRGELQFRFDDCALQIWVWQYGQNLAHGARILPAPNNNNQPAMPDALWQCCYVYARSSQLLAQVALVADRFNPQEQLDQHDRDILLQLLSIAEQLEIALLHPRSATYLKLATATSQAFEKLSRTSTSHALIQPFSLKFGLVLLIQGLLAQLLRAGLNVDLRENL
jgi:hypothetical protein